MAKKIREDKENTFVDAVSGITYQWLKEEVTPANGVSCWSAKDQWGNKDYFVVKEGIIIRGPYRTVKETVKALQEGIYNEADVVDSANEVGEEVSASQEDETASAEVEERVNTGLMNELRQASNQVTEIIRKCEELQQWSVDIGKDNIIEVLQSIIDEENENIGKIQAMLKSLCPENDKIDEGEAEAEEIMSSNDDVFGNVDEDIFEEGFGLTPMQISSLIEMSRQPEVQPQPTFVPKVEQSPIVAESVENVDMNQLMSERYGIDEVVDCDIIGF